MNAAARLGILGLCAGLSPAYAQMDMAAPVSVRYKCGAKHSLQVDYNIPGKVPRIQVTTGKKTWIMRPQEAASGTRYVDAKKTMQWRSEGPEGDLTDLKTQKSTRCTQTASSR